MVLPLHEILDISLGNWENTRIFGITLCLFEKKNENNIVSNYPKNTLGEPGKK